ncbi:MAG TPA: MBL fold metallo-hydrolase [Candidatus Acidoferrales bacterium]|nr:MBL fold metallo-hydrolase [Candidatus Acidoferrales bacterium]
MSQGSYEHWSVMKLADGVEVLELPVRGLMGQTVVHPTLIWDDKTVVMVDTGFPGQLPQIRKAIDETGVPFDRLNKVIITHQDVDHIGGLPDIVREYRVVQVLCHSEERLFIEGRRPLIKLARLAERAASLPDEQRQQIEMLLANPPKASVDATVEGGDVLPYCGGITVIFTPGHTPGHICLYLNQSKALIAGDALVVVDGELNGPNPQMAYDMDAAIKSLKKLTRCDVKTVICYHGGVYTKAVNERLAELANLRNCAP